MSFAEPGALESLMRLLEAHRLAAYGLLFAGALVETVLPFALLVPGEVVFLAGAILAGLGRLDLGAVILVLLAGGLLGDNVSYWLGRRYGAALFAWMHRIPFVGGVVSPRQRARARAFMRHRGPAAVFLARFGGPVSWVMPALAGAGRVPYQRFLRFNTPAVALGIGQFVIFGYLCGRHGGDAFALLKHGAWVTIPPLIAAAIAVWSLRRRKRRGLCAEARAR